MTLCLPECLIFWSLAWWGEPLGADQNWISPFYLRCFKLSEWTTRTPFPFFYSFYAFLNYLHRKSLLFMPEWDVSVECVRWKTFKVAQTSLIVFAQYESMARSALTHAAQLNTLCIRNSITWPSRYGRGDYKGKKIENYYVTPFHTDFRTGGSKRYCSRMSVRYFRTSWSELWK